LFFFFPGVAARGTFVSSSDRPIERSRPARSSRGRCLPPPWAVIGEDLRVQALPFFPSFPFEKDTVGSRKVPFPPRQRVLSSFFGAKSVRGTLFLWGGDPSPFPSSVWSPPSPFFSRSFSNIKPFVPRALTFFSFFFFPKRQGANQLPLFPI